MIPRWMPFSTPIYIDPIKEVFERLTEQSKTQQEAIVEEVIEEEEKKEEVRDVLQEACD